jgi:hypothetical protein
VSLLSEKTIAAIKSIPDAEPKALREYYYSSDDSDDIGIRFDVEPRAKTPAGYSDVHAFIGWAVEEPRADQLRREVETLLKDMGLHIASSPEHGVAVFPWKL